jgi:hypothetical protein
LNNHRKKIMNKQTKLLSPAEYGKTLIPPVSARRVTTLLKEGKIPEAQKVGGSWVIPADALDPRDKRYTRG